MSESVVIVKEAALAAQSALRQHPNDLPLLRVAAASHALAGIWQTHKEHRQTSAQDAGGQRAVELAVATDNRVFA
jgi:hypothetical protein